MGVLQEIFGSKPSVPPLQKLNLQSEQQTAITGNLSALPATEKLVGQANQFTQQQIQQMLSSVIPNYGEITGAASTDIESLLKGQIPTDVSNAVQSNAAARALSGGFAGSGMHGDLVARDLGLTSLNLIDKGISSAESWLKTMDAMYQPGMMNVSSMFISPLQQAGFDVEERNMQFERSWLQNQINAMPDPVLGGIESRIYGLAEAYLSKGGGGNFGGPTGPQQQQAGIANQGMSM